MKPQIYLLTLVFLALFTFSCSTDDLQDETLNQTVLSKVPKSKTIELDIMERINTYRIEKGLNPLHNLDVVKKVAFSHTDYMVAVNAVNHDNFYQRKNSLVHEVGATKVSENVAYAYSTAESVVNAWINSPDHLANIEGDFTDFEISAEQNAEGKWYYTNIFIKR